MGVVLGREAMRAGREEKGERRNVRRKNPERDKVIWGLIRARAMKSNLPFVLVFFFFGIVLSEKEKANLFYF